MVPNTESASAAPDSDQAAPSREDARADTVVLICDRDSALRARVEETLRAAGFMTFIGANDQADAADLCDDLPPDVILFRPAPDLEIDQGLSDRLRSLNPEHDLSVLFLDDGSSDDRREAMLRFGDGCIKLDEEFDEFPQRVLVHAKLHLLAKKLEHERSAMERKVEKRTHRLNKALDLLRSAEQRLESELTNAKSETRERIDYFAETQHELRTPLNAICGMSDAIRTEMFGALDNPKYKDYADNIYQSGQHLLSIIDGRLEMSRIEAGADPLEIEQVDVADVIHETTEMLGRIAEKANVALDIDVEPDLPVIDTDPRKLRQVLINLVSNAIKFTPDAGRVLLSVKRNAKKGVLVLVVSDTGIGMSPNAVQDAVKPYRRLSADRRSGERGNGLGLPIVRKLVETLGATIEIQSSPGRGTSVRIELPMHAPGDSPPMREAS